MRKTLAQRSRGGVSEAECHAMRLLSEDGWSYGQLVLTFEVSDRTVGRHVNGDCSHSPFPVPGVSDGE